MREPLIRLLPALAVAALVPLGCGVPAGPAASPEPAPPSLLDVPTSPQDERRAAELVGEGRAALDRGDAGEALVVAEAVMERFPGAQASSAALLLAARARAALGQLEAALADARRYVSLFPAGASGAEPGHALVEELEARVRVAAERPSFPLVLGAILPRSGSPVLQRYADLVLEGARLAVDEYRARGERDAELIVVDDLGDPAAAGQRVRELEEAGALGVVGPLLAPSLEAAAAGRTSHSFPLVSPTASEIPPGPALYTLNAAGTRGARALAEYAVARGARTVGTLYPLTVDFRRQAAAFAEAARGAGAQVVAEVPYDSGSTSFAAVIGRLRDAAPEAVFIPAPERDVRQLAPQLAFYWLQAAALGDTTAADSAAPGDTLVVAPPEHAEVLVLGGEAWAAEPVLRTVAPRIIEGVVVAVPLYRPGREAASPEFVRLYESRYRRTLDNPYPALGYDAARLLLEAASRAQRPSPDDVAAALSEIRGLQGATGILSAQEGRVERTPWLVRIEGGRLIPVVVPDTAEGGGPR